MNTTSVLVLIFVVVPGFVADNVLRAAYVDRQLTDFERTVRSIVFSAFGLLTYLTLANGIRSLGHRFGLSSPDWITSPPYLPALGDAAAKTPVVLDAKALLPFLLHTLVTVFVALGWGKLLHAPKFQTYFFKKTGRVTGGTAWQLLWSRFSYVTGEEQRSVTVTLSDGRRIMGYLQAASSPIDDKDIVLGHPWFWNSARNDWYAENARFVYIPESMIEYISLSPAGSETALSGFLRDLRAHQTANRSYEDE